MNILAIETSTGPCSTAIWKDGRIAAYLENPKPVQQSASLMPMVEQVMAQSNMQYRDLTAIACSIGPGSFTGIRVGLAAARGIAFASKLKLLGFTTLEVLAYAARGQHERMLAVINAGKGEVYYQEFVSQPFAEKTAATLGTFEKASNTLPVVGNIDAETITFPRADALAELAANYPQRAKPPSPFYIRPPDAKPQNAFLSC